MSDERIRGLGILRVHASRTIWAASYTSYTREKTVQSRYDQLDTQETTIVHTTSSYAEGMTSTSLIRSELDQLQSQ